MRFLSVLFASIYWTTRHGLLGISFRTWLIIIPSFLFLLGGALRWSPALTFFWLVLAGLFALLYMALSRVGYKRFVPDPAMALDDDFAAPHHEDRVPLRATGIFSVRDRENYVLDNPAHYWRVPLGQHVFMVEEQPGSFLYQIIDPENIRNVEPGHLLFGRQPQEALALSFEVSWSPELATEPSYHYHGKPEPENRPPGRERTVYLTFDHDADRYAVWKSLLQDTG